MPESAGLQQSVCKIGAVLQPQVPNAPAVLVPPLFVTVEVRSVRSACEQLGHQLGFCARACGLVKFSAFDAFQADAPAAPEIAGDVHPTFKRVTVHDTDVVDGERVHTFRCHA
jgi:hypothetical protein